MKGPFSIWAFFGLTLWIDVITHLIYPRKDKKIDPYKPLRQVSVIVPVHKEPSVYIEQTIIALYKERYPIKNTIICGDSESKEAKKIVNELSKKYGNLYFIECPNKSKAKKINYVASKYKKILGEFIYVRDCRVKGAIDCIEKMISYFDKDEVAAFKSYCRVSVPQNFH